MHKSSLSVLSFLTAVWILLAPGLALANGIVVSPAMKDLSLEPAQDKVTFEFKLKNDTEDTAVLKLSTLDFGSLDESGGVAFISRSTDGLTTKYGLKSWIKFSKDSVVLSAGQEETLQAIIENKDSLTPGGHYGAIIVTPVTINPDGSENTVAVNPALSILVFLKKLGGERYDLVLDKPVVDGSAFQLPATLNLRFQNAGNVHVVPRGTISIKSSEGKVVSEGIINESSSAILPETFRMFQQDLKRSSFLTMPGKYKLEVDWRYDGRDEFQKTVVEFYYLGPILYLAIGIFCIALICIVVFKSTKRNKFIHNRG